MNGNGYTTTLFPGVVKIGVLYTYTCIVVRLDLRPMNQLHVLPIEPFDDTDR